MSKPKVHNFGERSWISLRKPNAQSSPLQSFRAFATPTYKLLSRSELIEITRVDESGSSRLLPSSLAWCPVWSTCLLLHIPKLPSHMPMLAIFPPCSQPHVPPASGQLLSTSVQPTGHSLLRDFGLCDSSSFNLKTGTKPPKNSKINKNWHCQGKNTH